MIRTEDRAKRGRHYRYAVDLAVTSRRQPRPPLRRQRTRRQAVLATVRQEA